MWKVELAQFVRCKKRNGGSFSSHFQWFYSILSCWMLVLCFCSWIQTKVGMKCLLHKWVFIDLCPKKKNSDNKVAGWFQLDNDVCFKMVFIMMSVLTFGNTWLWMGMGPHHIHWTLKKIWLTMWTIGLFNKKIYWMHGILPLI